MAHSTKADTRGTEKSSQNRERSDRGLTTLEWLLIVAAVAGLAALAVVLVQNVVDETAEQISGSNARVTAARVAAQEITDDTEVAFDAASGAEEENENKAKRTKANTDGKAKCERLEITYGDALNEEGLEAYWGKFGDAGTPGVVDESDHSECHIK